MKDTKFFEQALELIAPWKVLDVNLDVVAKKVEVKVDCGSDQMWLDPQSGKRLHIHGYEQRQWQEGEESVAGFVATRRSIGRGCLGKCFLLHGKCRFEINLGGFNMFVTEPQCDDRVSDCIH
jgi:hypothetical protein